MKAAKDAGEEHYEPTREDNIRRRNETILALWEEHLKDPIVALDKALKCVEILRWRSRPECLAEGCLAMAGVGSLPLLWEKPSWEGVWPYWDPMDSVCLRTASMERNVPRKYGPHGELFFFLILKEPATELVCETFSPVFNADMRTLLFSANVLKKCVAEHGFQVPGLGDEWKRESEGAALSEDENASSSGSREGNVCNDPLHVIGLCGPGDKISLFWEDWEVAKVALTCHIALDMLCQELIWALVALTVDGL